jgi:hypothetical protein
MTYSHYTLLGMVNSFFTEYDIEDYSSIYDIYMNYTIHINNEYEDYEEHEDHKDQNESKEINLETYGTINTLMPEDKECSICFEEFKDVYFSTHCHHLFHRECITTWLHKKKNCPVCRHSFH